MRSVLVVYDAIIDDGDFDDDVSLDDVNL